MCDNFSPHLSTATGTQVGDWAAANNVELAPATLVTRGARA